MITNNVLASDLRYGALSWTSELWLRRYRSNWWRRKKTIENRATFFLESEIKLANLKCDTNVIWCIIFATALFEFEFAMRPHSYTSFEAKIGNLFWSMKSWTWVSSLFIDYFCYSLRNYVIYFSRFILFFPTYLVSRAPKKTPVTNHFLLRRFSLAHAKVQCCWEDVIYETQYILSEGFS